MNLKETRSGTVESIKDDYKYPSYAWVDVCVGTEIIRLLIPQKIVQEKNVTVDKVFSWEVYRWKLLNDFLNPIQEITQDEPPSLDHLLPGNW